MAARIFAMKGRFWFPFPIDAIVGPGRAVCPVTKVDGEIGGRRDDEIGMRGAETPTPIGGSDGRAPAQVRLRCEAVRSMPC
jgi:hypothetical protein